MDEKPAKDGKPTTKGGPGMTLASATKAPSATGGVPGAGVPSAAESDLETTPKGITYRIRY